MYRVGYWCGKQQLVPSELVCRRSVCLGLSVSLGRAGRADDHTHTMSIMQPHPGWITGIAVAYLRSIPKPHGQSYMFCLASKPLDTKMHPQARNLTACALFRLVDCFEAYTTPQHFRCGRVSSKSTLSFAPCVTKASP